MEEERKQLIDPDELDFFNPHHRDELAKMPAHAQIIKFYHDRLGGDSTDYFMVRKRIPRATLF